jgi:hypothetical protein
VTLDKTDLGARAGHLPDSLMDDVDRGLRRLLSLWKESYVRRLGEDVTVSPVKASKNKTTNPP